MTNKEEITSKLKEFVCLNMKRYDVNYITFKLEGFGFVDVSIRGFDKKYSTYMSLNIAHVPYIRLLDIFNDIEKMSNIKNENNETLFVRECKIYLLNGKCYGWDVEFVARDMDNDEECYSIYPEEWEKTIVL